MRLVLIVFAFTVVAAFAGTTAARAASGDDEAKVPAGAGGRRIVLLRFHGSGADVVRAAVLEKAKEQRGLIEIVPLDLVEQQRNLHGNPRARSVEIARRLDLTALVRGHVKRKKSRLQAVLTVVSGDDGRVAGEATFAGRSALALYATIRAELGDKLLPLLDKCAPPAGAHPAGAVAETPEPAEKPERAAPGRAAPAKPEETGPGAGSHVAAPVAEAEAGAEEKPETKKEAEQKEAEEPEEKAGAAAAEARETAPAAEPEPEPEPARRRRCTWGELETSGGALMRAYDYRDEQMGALRGFLLKGTWLGRFDAAFYPFAISACGALSHIGLRGGAQRSFGATAHLADRTLGTNGYVEYADLVVRIPMGSMLTLKPGVGFLRRNYWVNANEVPDVDYWTVGPLLDVELRGELFFFEIGASGRKVLKGGDIQSARWFPQMTAFGLTAQARLGAALTSWLDMLVGASVEAYRLDFHTFMGEMLPNGLAAGADDRYLTLFGGFRVRAGHSE